MSAAATTVTGGRTAVGPGATHHVGGAVLCRPAWRVPWLAPLRVIILLLVAATARVVGDVNLGGLAVHHAAMVVEWPAVAIAAYVAVHPVLLRAQFRRTRSGIPVEVAWAGRDHSGQPWLVLRGADRRAWRARPRQGPVEYPVPRWRGTPWLYPPAFDAVAVRGTLVRPKWTWRRGLVLHGHPGEAGEGPKASWAVIAFGGDPALCVGVHLRALRRLPARPSQADLPARSSG
jgi:hypothetical protein